MLMKQLSSPPSRLLFSVMALLALGAASVRAEDVYITGGRLNDVNFCPPSCPYGLVTPYRASHVSTACTNHRTLSVFGSASAAGWKVTPTLANSPGMYRILVTKGQASDCPPDIVVNTTTTGGVLADANGTAQTTVPTTAFQGTNSVNTWIWSATSPTTRLGRRHLRLRQRDAAFRGGTWTPLISNPLMTPTPRRPGSPKSSTATRHHLRHRPRRPSLRPCQFHQRGQSAESMDPGADQHRRRRNLQLQPHPRRGQSQVLPSHHPITHPPGFARKTRTAPLLSCPVLKSPVELRSRTNRQAVLLCLLLAVVTLAVFWPVRLNDFIEYDDQDYVTANSQVQRGLSWEGLAWAFTTGHAANWHPLTWLSHALDVQLFGLNPAGHHLTSLLFHIANTLLIFLFLRRTTGATWRSAFVAAFFALHPLHVESVAWVAERKDVLSTFFGLLSLWAYAAYAAEREGGNPKVRNPKTEGNPKPEIREPNREVRCQGRRATSSRITLSRFYLLSLLLFAFSLMSKPMLVTLPFLLLLLDYWPLGRWQPGPAARTHGQTSASRKGPVPDPLRPLDHGDIIRPARGHVLLPAAFIPRPRSECGDVLRPLSRQDVLAAGPGRVLSPSRALAGVGSGRLSAAGSDDFRPGAVGLPTTPLSAGRLVLVPGPAGAGAGIGPGRRPGHGRPLHLPAVGRDFHPPGLGRRRMSGGLAPSRPGRHRPPPLLVLVLCAALTRCPAPVLAQHRNHLHPRYRRDPE